MTKTFQLRDKDFYYRTEKDGIEYLTNQFLN